MKIQDAINAEMTRDEFDSIALYFYSKGMQMAATLIKNNADDFTEEEGIAFARVQSGRLWEALAETDHARQKVLLKELEMI